MEADTMKDDSAVFDFRSIHDHPPVDPIKGDVEIVKDPSWDTHKVFFSEFDNSVDKPKDLDAVNMFDVDGAFPDSNAFGGSDATTVSFQPSPSGKLENGMDETAPMVGQPLQLDDDVDPLGWPRTPEGFLDNAPPADPFECCLTRDMIPDDLNDDEDLLETEPVHNDEFYIPDENGAVLTKEERIAQYTSIAADEASDHASDEEGLSSEEEEEEEDLKYKEQSNLGEEDDDEDNVSAFSPATAADAIAAINLDSDNQDQGNKFQPCFNNDPNKPSESNSSLTAPIGGLDQLGVVHISLVGGSGNKRAARSKKLGNLGSVIPLLRPPPEEKLKKWMER